MCSACHGNRCILTSCYYRPRTLSGLWLPKIGPSPVSVVLFEYEPRVEGKVEVGRWFVQGGADSVFGLTQRYVVDLLIL